jgi:hypothetical protein
LSPPGWDQADREEAGDGKRGAFGGDSSDTGGTMRINKQELHKLVEDLPEPVETDEVLYRLYLREKLNAAEEDIREGRALTHEEVVAETAKWFSE